MMLGVEGKAFRGDADLRPAFGMGMGKSGLGYDVKPSASPGS